ncbi:hypothetical protein AAIR98_000378 [Elusimicrobium simillimum]|uniref:metallophosphoesterase n=1 Tax=Elusimicrobium simillimum TaxID=3143438 RepID=UPI003C6F04AA
MNLFYVVVFGIFFAFNLFVGGIFYIFFPSKFTKILLWALPIAGPLFILLSFAVNRRSEGYFGGLIAMLGHYWTGILGILVFIGIVMILAFVVLSLFKIPSIYWIGRTGLAFMVVFTLLGIMGGQTAPVVRQIDIKSPHLPVDKLKIVQISDTHLGTGVRVKRVRDMVKEINAQEPDIIVVTGDFFENGNKLVEKNANALKHMKAKYGIYGTLGNHEFYRGLKQSTHFFEKAGVELLRQQTVRPLPGVAVSGLDDFSTAHISKADFGRFLDGLNKNEFNIILQHEPKYYDVAQGKMDLMLSGHTHDGQIFPFRYLVKTRYPHVYGLYQKGRSSFYVTSGVFYWGPPMRLFSRNEIAVFNIEKE